MSRWRLLLEQLSFENRHPHARRGPWPLVRKIGRLLPDAAAFLLFNFGSSFGRNAIPDEPEPSPARRLPLLELADWPRHRQGERGLPHSDSVVGAVIFGGYELVDDPLFAMRELHRVCGPGATVTLDLRGAWLDPLQRRIANPESLAPFFESDHHRARALDVADLFRLRSATQARVVLEVVKAAPAIQPRRIDIGCGTATTAGYTGIDIAPLPGVDIVRDVDRHGLPFSDDTISAVISIHFVEHVQDLVLVMNEIHRVCCNGAVVIIDAPTLLGPHAAADPTHVRLFNARTFGYFTDEVPDGYGGAGGRFAIVSQSVSTTLRVVLRVLKPQR